MLVYKDLRELFLESSDTRERVFRFSDTVFKMPLLKTIIGLKAFSYKGAKLWNGLEM